MIIVVTTTLAWAVMLAPLHTYVQSLIDQRFNRHHYEAARAIEAFSSTLREEIDWVFLHLKKEGEWETGARGVSSRMLDDVEFPCACNGLRPALYLEFCVDRVHIPFHCAHRDHQPVRNLSIGAARDNQPQYLSLAFAQRFAERLNYGPGGLCRWVRHTVVYNLL